MKEFDTRLTCSNCGRGSTFKFPFGTELTKRPWGKGTRARIPTKEIPRWKEETVRCPRCGSKRIG